MIDDAEFSRIQAHVAAITQTPEYIALKARVDGLKAKHPATPALHMVLSPDKPGSDDSGNT